MWIGLVLLPGVCLYEEIQDPVAEWGIKFKDLQLESMHSIEGRAIVYKHQPHIVLFIAVSVDEGGVKDVRYADLLVW